MLANHTAHIDPLILFTWLWPKLKMRFLIVESMARLPFLRTMITLINPVIIPDFETSLNQFKLKKARKALKEISKGLNQGDNFVIYPSGKFKNQGKEIIGGASGAYEVVQQSEDPTILLVRITGFWGSSFSKAMTGKSPDWFDTSIKGLKTLFKNFLFFTPRRDISLELEMNPTELLQPKNRQTFNAYLEHWFNQYRDKNGAIHTSEPLTLVPYQFWSKRVPVTSTLPKKKNIQSSFSIDPKVREKVFSEIRKILSDSQLKITSESHLRTDLGMDSLNIAELIAYLSRNYEIKEIEPNNLDTVQTVLKIVSGASPTKPLLSSLPNQSWAVEPNRPNPEEIIGKTFPETFLHICEKMGSFSAIADDFAGILSYKDCKRSVLVLAQYFKTFPEERIAVMFPASAAALLVVLALHFAKKVPVMLNWTLGPKHLEDMMRISGAQRTISSWRFTEQLSHVDFGSVSEQIIFLEDIRQNLSIWKKLKGTALSYFPSSFILKRLDLDKLDEDQFAVILFSSGTESSPKGVPLSHKNVLSTIKISFWNFSEVVSAKDSMYGILPPFHSFGFSLAGFLPLFCGMFVSFYPNPTDNLQVARGLMHWKATCFPIVPSLLKKLFLTAENKQLKSVRFFMTAGEKASVELFERVKEINPEAQLIEGYGLTETSPTVSLMRPNLPSKGVGRLLPIVDVITIHHENQSPLSSGEKGEICIRGPNVFSGYLESSISPFIEIHGQMWFRTGDIGYVDADKTLVLTDRLKRFIKIGGEMLSLGGIENALVKICIEKHMIKEDLPSIAICSSKNSEEDPKLFAFTTFPIDKETLNQFLREAGFSPLVKISKTQKVEEIPLFGTGKINYRSLQSLIG